MYDTILVSVDGSDGSNRAIEHALTLAERFDATVHALYVVDTHRYGETALSSAELVISELEDRGAALLDELAANADNRGVAVETRCCHGLPSAEILEHAARVDADVVVLGSRGHSRRPTLGSVADRVVTHADRPVFVV
jgi:nucleotide-binding universal stress UspA family protein